MSLPYHSIDPVLFSTGPLSVRWYSLAYIASILIGTWYVKFLSRKASINLHKGFFENLIVAIVGGIIIGGKLGYVLFYDLHYLSTHPLEILSGHGFAFHGGLVGVIIGLCILAKRYNANHWQVLDLCACAAPIGIFLVRIANFVNGEVFGRATSVSWAMVFPHGGNVARHPSQLYEAATEGLLLFIIMTVLFLHYQAYKQPRLLSGLFGVLYASFRFTSEFFREPDMQLGYFFGWMTMGQILSVLMLICGSYLIRTRN
jgi:phosphatidylglycerol:prolipoprotein diacylglycerol transferase